MKDRIIVHMDINHCYAQIEEVRSPALRHQAMAVGGDVRRRHGIILAKNDPAAAAGVKTGETLREAMRKCPGLKILPPDYDEYMRLTEYVREIYADWSAFVEPYGLDEAWIDVTALYENAGAAVHGVTAVMKRIERETGLTVSAGISWNKVFAKLGSDMSAARETSLIGRDNYRDLVWPRPVRELMHVGPASAGRLRLLGVNTIGDLAVYPVSELREVFGLPGEIMRTAARGEDQEGVAAYGFQKPQEALGMTVTMMRDVDSFEDLSAVFCIVAEQLTARLRQLGMECRVIAVSLRTTDLKWQTVQRKLPAGTDLGAELWRESMALLKEKYTLTKPLRAAGLTLTELSIAESSRQLSLFTDEKRRDRLRSLEKACDDIRERFGAGMVRRGCTLMDTELADPVYTAEHIPGPAGRFGGRKSMTDGSV